MSTARGTPWHFIIPQVGIALGLLLVGALLLGAPEWRGFPIPAWVSPFLLVMGLLSIGWVLILFFFFRDPDRVIGDGVVSPADGRVRAAEATGMGASLSIVLGVFDVHVIRAPIAGRVTSLAYKPGGKRFAFSKDSHLNERLVLSIAGQGESCSLTLIAGAFADRIETYVETGGQVLKGERIGIIKFGSRVDIDYAADAASDLAVKVGDTVIAGCTSILLRRGEAAPP